MSGQNGLAYSPAPSITWVKDADQTILVDSLGGKSWALVGLEAAVWDLMALGYTAEGITDAMAISAGVEGEQGRAMLWAMVRRWQAAGILSAAEAKRP
jgi:hypothetical protein